MWLLPTSSHTNQFSCLINASHRPLETDGPGRRIQQAGWIKCTEERSIEYIKVIPGQESSRHQEARGTEKLLEAVNVNLAHRDWHLLRGGQVCFLEGCELKIHAWRSVILTEDPSVLFMTPVAATITSNYRTNKQTHN